MRQPMSCWRTHVSWISLLTVLMAAGPIPTGAAARDDTLVDAVKRLDRSLLAALLEQGVDVNEAAPDGTTALHWAAHHGALDTVTRLIGAGADVAALNRYDISPVWLAAEEGHGGVVEALLRAGADPGTTRGMSGESLTMIAARAGRVDVVRRLVAHGADVDVAERVRNQTALMWAAAEGHADAVRVLARAGADLEAQSSIGMTPLMFSIRAGDMSTIGELIDLGADVGATTPDGTTTLALAIINARWEAAAFLVRRGADPNGNDAIHGRPLQALAFMRRAVNRGLSGVLPRRPTGNISSIELADVLLEHGAVVDDRIDWENPNHMPPHMSLPFFFTISFVDATPFFIAAKNCDVEFMKFLLANGANPYLATAQNLTPLLAAAGVGHSTGESPETPEEALEAVRLIHELGGDLTAVVVAREGGGGGGGRGRRRSITGSSVLHGAVTREAPELLRWLIEHDAPLEQENVAGDTALESAYLYGLSNTKLTRLVMADMLREAMISRGLAVPPAGPPSDGGAQN